MMRSSRLALIVNRTLTWVCAAACVAFLIRLAVWGFTALWIIPYLGLELATLGVGWRLLIVLELNPAKRTSRFLYSWCLGRASLFLFYVVLGVVLRYPNHSFRVEGAVFTLIGALCVLERWRTIRSTVLPGLFNRAWLDSDLALFAKVTICFVLWRVTVPYDLRPVLKGDPVVYFAQATRYIDTNFYPTSWLKAFSHPLIYAHFLGLMGTQKELVFLFFKPAVEMFMLALAVRELLAGRDRGQRSSGMWLSLAPVVLIGFAAVDWLPVSLVRVIWVFSRNILPTQLDYNPYTQSAALAVTGLAFLDRQNLRITTVRAGLFVFATLGLQVIFRPFIFYPILGAWALILLALFVRWRQLAVIQLGGFLAMAAGLFFLPIQLHMAATLASEGTVVFPRFVFRPWFLQDVGLRAITALLSPATMAAHQGWLRVCMFVAQPVTGLGVMSVILVSGWSRKSETGLGRGLVDWLLAVAAVIAWMIPTLWQIENNTSNDVAHFAITFFLLTGLLFWRRWPEWSSTTRTILGVLLLLQVVWGVWGYVNYFSSDFTYGSPRR
jgi:hypothetical protein